jgi:hypothetical protein
MNILSIVVTIVIIVLIIMLLRWILLDPYTLQSLQSAQTASTIAATSLASNGSNTPSSKFAYSIWFYINDWNYNYGKPKVLFGRLNPGGTDTSGNTQSGVQNVYGTNPCPLVVLGAVENNLGIILSCQGSPNPNVNLLHTCNVANIPIQTWVNLLISVYGRTLDVYMDGKLVKTCVLPGIAKIPATNPPSLYITPKGGFDGYTSKFQYWNTPLNPQQAWNVYNSGYNSVGGKLAGMFGQYKLDVTLMKNNTPVNSLQI